MRKLRYKKDSNAIDVNRGNIYFIYGLLIWPLIHFMVFWVYVNVATVENSFFQYTIDGSRTFNGINNYIKVFTDIFFKDSPNILNYRAFLNTLSIIPLALFINMPIMVFFAYFIYKKVAGFRVYRILLFTPAVISSVVLCLIFGAFVTPGGPFDTILTAIGLGGDGTGYDTGIIPISGWLADEKTAWGTLLVFSVICGISGYLIYFNSAMGRLPQEVFESAALDGASEVRQFFSIVVPMIWPIIITMSVQSVSSAFGWFMPTLLLSPGNKYSTTIGMIIVNQARSGEQSVTGIVSAMAVTVSIIGGIIVLSFKTIMEKFFREVQY